MFNQSIISMTLLYIQMHQTKFSSEQSRAWSILSFLLKFNLLKSVAAHCSLLNLRSPKNQKLELEEFEDFFKTLEECNLKLKKFIDNILADKKFKKSCHKLYEAIRGLWEDKSNMHDEALKEKLFKTISGKHQEDLSAMLQPATYERSAEPGAVATSVIDLVGALDILESIFKAATSILEERKQDQQDQSNHGASTAPSEDMIEFALGRLKDGVDVDGLIQEIGNDEKRSKLLVEQAKCHLLKKSYQAWALQAEKRTNFEDGWEGVLTVMDFLQWLASESQSQHQNQNPTADADAATAAAAEAQESKQEGGPQLEAELEQHLVLVETALAKALDADAGLDSGLGDGDSGLNGDAQVAQVSTVQPDAEAAAAEAAAAAQSNLDSDAHRHPGPLPPSDADAAVAPEQLPASSEAAAMATATATEAKAPMSMSTPHPEVAAPESPDPDTTNGAEAGQPRVAGPGASTDDSEPPADFEPSRFWKWDDSVLACLYEGQFDQSIAAAKSHPSFTRYWAELMAELALPLDEQPDFGEVETSDPLADLQEFAAFLRKQDLSGSTPTTQTQTVAAVAAANPESQKQAAAATANAGGNAVVNAVKSESTSEEEVEVKGGKSRAITTDIPGLPGPKTSAVSVSVPVPLFLSSVSFEHLNIKL